ncbi:MAG: hypothetical protein ACD_16C00099G0025 [uncultured bacterium]|nr:MAG: hypothetical protein ACD_16C00099G0025 [uncultured bacterium]OFW68135.1 MAG: hypothetical protein A2X70_05495 [Alphaproteobacteria bacterium GWC2_42_16]OFW73528.1 MAG: hypothetical protein A2Z80_06795 [Alphaproteobacteria bacterium GWA2_41_27]OFW82377.1 MAG: hypothetical protein A3E50_04195 [Alphaproteobacteria bacterium RIFCSPHIGHO2_12_FULL_42_100]OFW86203.1 MAG: hypothetical protein A2W06_01125 [Alphaproteobacteria bacterium RBG_16_42_14]OFW91761.1 MAG: hypothetical protein A3C41_011
MIKCFFWVLIFASIGSFDKAFSASTASSSKTSSTQTEPSVPFSSTYIKKLAGVSNSMNGNNRLNCSFLLKKTWAYPNALVTPFCYNAETSCVGLQLFTTYMQNAKGSDLSDMKATYPYIRANVLMNLYACAEALQATLTNNKVVLPSFGYYTYPRSTTGQP